MGLWPGFDIYEKEELAQERFISCWFAFFFAWELCDRPGIDSAVGWQLSALLWEHSPSRGIKALNSQRHFNLHISQPDLDFTPNTGSNVALTIFE